MLCQLCLHCAEGLSDTGASSPTRSPNRINIISKGSSFILFWLSSHTLYTRGTLRSSSLVVPFGRGSHILTTCSIPLVAREHPLGFHWTQLAIDSSAVRTLTRVPLLLSHRNTFPSSLPAPMYSPLSPMKDASFISVCVLQ